MKRLLLIVLLFSIGYSQNLIPVIETYNDGNIKSITYHKKTRNGIEKVKYERYYEIGQKKSEGVIKNGDSTGVWTYWYEGGQKWSERTYKDGELNGLGTKWYENGQKLLEGTFKDGLPNGKFTEWYENGQKREETTYKDGKEEGKCIYYTKNREGRYILIYHSGELQTESTFYDNLGQHYKGVLLANPKPLREWVGQKDFKGGYLFYQEHKGRYQAYLLTMYPHDHVYLDSNKVRQGKETTWYENGQKREETTYKDGEKDGLWTHWHENGQKKGEGTFKDGKLISEECWDEDGNEKECY